MTTTMTIAKTQPPPRVATGDREFLTFRVDGKLFGLPLLSVHDVLDSRPLTPVPLAPPEVAGALNLRGRIITAIDLRRRLGLAPRPAGSRHMSLVVEHDGEMYNLIVDAVGEVLSVGDDACGEPPPTLDPLWRQFAASVYRLDHQLMVVLDVVALLTIHP